MGYWCTWDMGCRGNITHLVSLRGPMRGSPSRSLLLAQAWLLLVPCSLLLLLWLLWLLWLLLPPCCCSCCCGGCWWWWWCWCLVGREWEYKLTVRWERELVVALEKEVRSV